MEPNRLQKRGFAPNPDYGGGIYRRAIHLAAHAGMAHGTLHDTVHAMRMTVRHAEGRVDSVEGELLRVPVSTCPGAVEPLAELSGLPLDLPFRSLFGGGRPVRHCSHMFDLFWLLCRQAQRGSGERRYDIAIPDQADDDLPQDVMLSRDGASLLHWRVRAGAIVSPAPFAGRKVLSGFASWASETFGGDALEAALVLQKGVFVAQARRYRLPPTGTPTGRIDEIMRGTCWTYTSPRFEVATKRDSVRDMTDATTLDVFG